jgi:DNA-binding response OmpR family regulator
MPFDKQLLVIATDPTVRRTKQLLLEELGFSVIAVGTLRELEYVASRSLFDLAILGRSVGDAVKRQAAQIIRLKLPATPILEICNQSHCVDDPDYVLHGFNPEDLADIVRTIFKLPVGKAQKAPEA